MGGQEAAPQLRAKWIRGSTGCNQQVGGQTARERWGHRAGGSRWEASPEGSPRVCRWQRVGCPCRHTANSFCRPAQCPLPTAFPSSTHLDGQRRPRIPRLEGAPRPLRPAQQGEEGGGGGGVAAQRAVLNVVAAPARAAEDVADAVKPLQPACACEEAASPPWLPCCCCWHTM